MTDRTTEEARKAMLIRAAELLRQEATAIKDSHTLEGDWAGECEAKSAHDEMLNVAAALQWQAEQQKGDDGRGLEACVTCGQPAASPHGVPPGYVLVPVTTPTEQPEAIRLADLIDALAMVQPAGAFHKSRSAVQIDETEDWPAIRIEVRANKLVGPKVARYIECANPAVVGSLLAELRRLHAAREADREAMRMALVALNSLRMDMAPGDLTESELAAIKALEQRVGES